MPEHEDFCICGQVAVTAWGVVGEQTSICLGLNRTRLYKSLRILRYVAQNSPTLPRRLSASVESHPDEMVGRLEFSNESLMSHFTQSHVPSEGKTSLSVGRWHGFGVRLKTNTCKSTNIY